MLITNDAANKQKAESVSRRGIGSRVVSSLTNLSCVKEQLLCVTVAQAVERRSKVYPEIVDLAALVVIGAVSVLFAVTFSTSMQEAFKSFAIVAVIGVAFIFLLPFFQGWVLRILHAIPILNPALKNKLEEQFKKSVGGAPIEVRRSLFGVLLLAHSRRH